jgi:phenylacetate-CoA ligase
VEQVFGVSVYDRYGNRECGAIASECAHHDGLHVNESDCLIEIDSPDPFHIPGQILVTYLRNFAMPLVRYETGDVAKFSSRDVCACGRTTLRLSHVLGRQSDAIRTAHGTLVHGEFFTHVLYGSDAVREFQFIQESLESYTLRLVADRVRTAPMEAAWRAQILDVVGRRCNLSIEYVDNIPTLSSGKRKFTLSKVAAV